MRYLSLVLLFFVVLQSCGGPDEKAVASDQITAPAFVSRNPDTFNRPFEHLLTTYYSLRDAFVEYDTAKINAVSKELAAEAGNIPVDDLKDSSGVVKITAKDGAATVENAGREIAMQADFTRKQRQFQTVSDAMYELVRTVKYDKQKIYHQHCPMAFDNQGAYWISSSNEIVNPYMGKKHPKYRSAMLECGDIPDSLDFSRK